MFTLNIILLIASVALLVVGLVLARKPNPAYYLNEKTGKADKYKNYSLLLLVYVVPCIIYFTMSILDVEQLPKLIVYISFLILLAFISYGICCTSNITSKQNKDTKTDKKKRIINYDGYFMTLVSILTGFFSRYLLVVITMIVLMTIRYAFKFRHFYKNKLTVNIYSYLSGWFVLITGYLFIHTLNLKEVPEFISNIQTCTIFLAQIPFLLCILDIKKHSPIYEKQYLEENSLQTNVSNNP